MHIEQVPVDGKRKQRKERRKFVISGHPLLVLSTSSSARFQIFFSFPPSSLHAKMENDIKMIMKVFSLSIDDSIPFKYIGGAISLNHSYQKFKRRSRSNYNFKFGVKFPHVCLRNSTTI